MEPSRAERRRAKKIQAKTADYEKSGFLKHGNIQARAFRISGAVNRSRYMPDGSKNQHQQIR